MMLYSAAEVKAPAAKIKRVFRRSVSSRHRSEVQRNNERSPIYDEDY
jgi:hypothetical protein